MTVARRQLSHWRQIIALCVFYGNREEFIDNQEKYGVKYGKIRSKIK